MKTKKNKKIFEKNFKNMHKINYIEIENIRKHIYL